MSSHFNVRRNKLKLELLLFDPETRTGSRTGLYYYRARMYHPELGRFMQTDPIGYYDAMNLYQYCGNNPVNWIDPYGEAGFWGGVLEYLVIKPLEIIEKTFSLEILDKERPRRMEKRKRIQEQIIDDYDNGKE